MHHNLEVLAFYQPAQSTTSEANVQQLIEREKKKKDSSYQKIKRQLYTGFIHIHNSL